MNKLRDPNVPLRLPITSRAPPLMLSIAELALIAKRDKLVKLERRPGDRFREHLRDVENNDKDACKPVSRHLNLPCHSQQHGAVCGLSLHLGSSESCKTLEQKFLFQIGTLNLHSINERFSFSKLILVSLVTMFPPIIYLRFQCVNTHRSQDSSTCSHEGPVNDSNVSIETHYGG